MSYYKEFAPIPALSSLIRAIEVYHVDWNTGAGLPEPFITCLANTDQCLYFYLKDTIRVVPAENIEVPVPPVVITGPKTKPVGLMFGKDHLMVKVNFHPTGTYRLLGLEMKETINNGLDATRFWGNAVNDVLQQLRASTAYEDMVDVINAFIQSKFDSRCRPEEPIDLAAIKMLDPLSNHSQVEWAAIACLSQRQFERNFMTRTGVTPKLFLRIVRFEYAMKIKNQFAEKNWSQIAEECGYTDSSHLLREFKEFAEFAPGKFYLQPTSGHSEFPTG